MILGVDIRYFLCYNCEAKNTTEGGTMFQVKKRDESIVPFNLNKIEIAMKRPSRLTKELHQRHNRASGA